MLGKDKLIFDPSAPDSTDNVGSFLRDAAGNLITSTAVGGKQGLDVNIISPLNINSISGTVNTTSNDPMKYVLNGGLVQVQEDDVNPANNQPLPVKLMGFSGNISINAAALNVELTDRGPDASAIKIGDGTNYLALNSDGSVNVVDKAKLAFKPQAVVVTQTAASLLSTPLAGRKWIEIQNLGNQEIFIGDSTVSATNGLRIARGAYWKGEVADSVNLFACTSSASSASVRIIEAA